ncbi:hypothetical protein CH272_26860 [Rhodococcus sp. 05-340-1]|nr:hypothetical protein CH271_12045 [Rhodococcus sp. 05-340-2]OZD70270.1 hypothetical protein CH272_26860 [Rhodococcus sp. 05-340-1]
MAERRRPASVDSDAARSDRAAVVGISADQSRWRDVEGGSVPRVGFGVGAFGPGGARCSTRSRGSPGDGRAGARTAGDASVADCSIECAD